MKLEMFLPVAIASLTVLLIGCWNPAFLRRRKPDPSGVAMDMHVNYMWLALFAFIAGAIAVWLQSSNGFKLGSVLN